MKTLKTIENRVNEPLCESGHGIRNGSRRCTHANFADSPQPLAYEELLDQCGGNPRFVGILLEAFKLQAVKDIDALQGALSHGDADQVANLAHSLRGAAASLRAGPIRIQAAQLEVLARSGDLRNARSSMTKLAIEFDHYRDFVSKIQS